MVVIYFPPTPVYTACSQKGKYQHLILFLMNKIFSIRLSQVWFVPGFESHQNKCGAVLYTSPLNDNSLQLTPPLPPTVSKGEQREEYYLVIFQVLKWKSCECVHLISGKFELCFLLSIWCSDNAPQIIYSHRWHLFARLQHHISEPSTLGFSHSNLSSVLGFL